MTTVRDNDDEMPTEPDEMLRGVTTVVDQQLVWDAANNLTGTIDHRDPAEWPAEHRPQTTYIRHDALYRVVQADFDYTQSDGSRTPVDDGSDWRDRFLATQSVDPMHQQPAPMTTSSTSTADRVANLTWTWDYLANTTDWTDDSGAFYERSLGGITNGDDESEDLRPSGLYLASNIGDGSGLGNGGGGWVEVDYDEGGNVEYMTVHGQCVDGAGTCADPGGSLSTRRSALRSNCTCAEEQHYEYRWDELNRLDEARRYDRSMGGSWSLEVRQRYRYDSANQRTVKQTLDQEGCSDPPDGMMTPCERVALYVYPGDFERRGLVRDGIALEYATEGVLPTETQYVVAGARTVFRHGVVAGSGYENGHRLVVGIGDLIQTTSAAFDVRTGMMIEASTYYPNGARETYLNDDGAYTAPEPSGFTGKEGDEEVGLVYFGERYLIPRLGRWASPDPLHVHANGGGEALNSYHYVAGSLLVTRDPLGLDPPAADAPPAGIRRRLVGEGSRTLRVPNWTADQPGGRRFEVSEANTGGTAARFRIGRGAMLNVRSNVRLEAREMPMNPQQDRGRSPRSIAISVHGDNASNYHFVNIGSNAIRFHGDERERVPGRGVTTSGRHLRTTDWENPNEWVDAMEGESIYYDEAPGATAHRGDTVVAMYDTPGAHAEGYLRDVVTSPNEGQIISVESRFHTYVVNQEGNPVARVDWRQTVDYRFNRTEGCWAGAGCWEVEQVGEARQQVDNARTLSAGQAREAAGEIRTAPRGQP